MELRLISSPFCFHSAGIAFWGTHLPPTLHKVLASVLFPEMHLHLFSQFEKMVNPFLLSKPPPAEKLMIKELSLQHHLPV